MVKTKKSDLNSILTSYSRKLNKEEQFHHILEQIIKHEPKLNKLRLEEDWKGHFKEEICDVFILSELLMQLEKVNQSALNKASKHFADKVKEIYRKE